MRTGIAVAILVGSAGLFGLTLARGFGFLPDLPIAAVGTTTPPKSSNAPQEVPNAGLPVRLSIPSIGVDAKVQHLGVDEDGNMDVPDNFSDAGWYKYGPLPGERGSAVIDGHVDNALGLPGVFTRLRDVRVGDDIFIQGEKGGSVHFVVSAVEIYPYDEVPGELLFNREDQPRLNLITCDGVWIPSGRTYNKRLVVYATLAES